MASNFNLMEVIQSQTTIRELPEVDRVWESFLKTDPDKVVYVYTYRGFEIGAILNEPASFGTLLEWAEGYLEHIENKG